MNKLCRAREIHRKEGFFSLISKSSNYIRMKIQRHFWPKYYSAKSSIFGSHVVKINNVLIDLDDETFSPLVKEAFRRKRYETQEAELINAHIAQEHPVIDLGAGTGYSTCLIDMKTDDSTPVVAVEANKSLIKVIERTKNINKSNFDILYSAYDSVDDSVAFHVAENFSSSSQHDREIRIKKKVTVPAVSLDKIIKGYSLECPIQLVLDIEGGESDLIKNERHILQNKVSLVIFEFHPFVDEKFECYSNILEENGFEFVESQDSVYVYRNTDI